MRTLVKIVARWHTAGRLWYVRDIVPVLSIVSDIVTRDVLRELSSMGNDLVPAEPVLSRKRPRQSQSQNIVDSLYIGAGAGTELSASSASSSYLGSQHLLNVNYDTVRIRNAFS